MSAVLTNARTRQTDPIAVFPGPRWAYAPLFRLERARLLELLTSLDGSDWDRPTPCPGWSVLGLATHLVGDDLSVVAVQRDHHVGTPAPAGLSDEQFIAWLDDLQAEWVHAARRISPRLVVELLTSLGDDVADVLAEQDPSTPTAHVSWASTDPAPVWLDHARELSERWIHRQQLLQSFDRSADLRADLAEPVLDGLRWAYPHRLGALFRPAGTRVVVAVTGPEVELRWTLITDGTDWRFGTLGEDRFDAELQLSTDQAWRLLTNNLGVAQRERLTATGDAEIVDVLLNTRAIIGTPKLGDMRNTQP
jgi:uncharacterized protein (TIGR03083 family)